MNTDVQEDALARLKAGDLAVMSIIYTAYAQRVRKYVIDQARDAQHADDLTSKAFLRFYSYVKSEEWERNKDKYQSIDHLLFRMATHALLDDKRKEEVEERGNQEYAATAIIAEPVPPDLVFQAKEAEELLIRGIVDLPTDQRGPAKRVYFDLLTYKETAELEGIPESTAKALVARARKLLAKNVTLINWKGNTHVSKRRISSARRSKRHLLARTEDESDARVQELPQGMDTEADAHPDDGDRFDRPGPDALHVHDVPPPGAEDGSHPRCAGRAESAAPGDPAEAAANHASAARPACDSAAPAAALSEVSAEAAEDGGRGELHAAVGIDGPL